MLIATQDWRNSLATAVEIIAGFGGLALVIMAVAFCIYLFDRSTKGR